MAQRPLTRKEWGQWLLQEYEDWLPAIRTAKRFIRDETRRCYGLTRPGQQARVETPDGGVRPRIPASFGLLRRDCPELYRQAFTALEDAVWRTIHSAPAWARRYGPRRLTARLIVAPAWEITLVLLSLKHRRSLAWIHRQIREARRARRLASRSPL